MNVQDIAYNIFNSSPKSPKSIQLQLPEESTNNVNNDIFNIMLEIFQFGMVKFFGNEGKVDLNNVTEEDFFKIRRYFWSFGFEIFYKIYDKTDKLLTSNKTYENPTGLYEKVLTLDTELLKYEISFDYYKG